MIMLGNTQSKESTYKAVGEQRDALGCRSVVRPSDREHQIRPPAGLDHLIDEAPRVGSVRISHDRDLVRRAEVQIQRAERLSEAARSRPHDALNQP